MITSEFDPTPDPSQDVDRDDIVLRRPVAWVPIALVCVVVIASVLFLRPGASLDGRPEPVSTTEPTPPVPSTIITAPARDPSLRGVLQDGRSFRVTEDSPGVLCLDFGAGQAGDGNSSDAADPESSEQICHTENLDASGARVIDGHLIFGYLAPGAVSAGVRYRSGVESRDGALVQTRARFFAVPILAADPYQLQYLDGQGNVIRENPLLPLTGDPSQSPTDADRDGIVAELAAVPFNRRVEISQELTSAPEGPYVISRPRPLRESNNCLIGDPRGNFGPDVICDLNYYEVLLLDDTGTRIARAYPFPGLIPTELFIGDGAVYVIGQGAPIIEADGLANGPAISGTGPGYGNQPSGFLARIDRITGDHIVRLFPEPGSDGSGDDLYPWWMIGDQLNVSAGSDFEGVATTISGDISIRLQTQVLLFDPVTLDQRPGHP